jgi:hypothetical protein
MIELALASVLIAGQPKVYVSGYGWVRAKTVGHCLVVAGGQHVDALFDSQWDEFVSCVIHNGG